MLRDRSTLVFGGLVVLALGMSLVLMPTGAPPKAEVVGEFPHDWFAPALEEEQAAQAKMVGQPMPPLDLTNWHNGEAKIEDFQGKVIVFDFWATWCAPCIAAFPDNNQLAAKYQQKGLEFIGICTNTGQENFEKIVETKKPEYPTARDEKLNTMNAWTAKSYPTYAVVDRKGIVRAIGLKHEYIEKVVEKLLAEPAS